VLACAVLAVEGLAGGGTFDVSRYAVGKHPIDLAVGDFDRDGRKDIAVTNFEDDPHSISILRGRRHGRFALARKIALGPADQPDGIVVTRLGADNDQDLVVGTLGEDVLLLKGRKGTRFKTPRREPFAPFDSPREVTVADFDRDGNRDIAVSRQGNDDIAVLLGEGGFKFAPPVPYGGAGGPPVVAARLDPGNALDLLTIDFGIDGLALHRGVGDGTFGAAEPLNAGDEVASVAVADLNRDGRNDILAGLTGPQPRLGVSRGEAGGAFAPQQVLTVGAGPMIVRDIARIRLNRDSDPDFAIVGPRLQAVRSAARGDKGPPPVARTIFLKGAAGVRLKRVREVNFVGEAPAVVASRFDGGGEDAAVVRTRFERRGQTVVILNP
jgi:hypothetical protein